MSGQMSDAEKRQELAILEVILDAQKRKRDRRGKLLDRLVLLLQIVSCIIFPPLALYYAIKYVLTHRA